MNAKRPDLAKLSPAEKDALIRDLWRQVAAGQSEARVLRRRLGIAEQASETGESALLERLREAAPRRPVDLLTGPPAGLAVKLGRVDRFKVLPDDLYFLWGKSLSHDL